MASEGPNSASAGANDATAGEIPWTDPGNITAGDSSFATCLLDGAMMEESQNLRASDFGFSLPDSTIDGIEVSIARQQDGDGNIEDLLIEILGAGGDNKAEAGAWPDSTTTNFYGGSSDDWNAGQTYTDINDSSFTIQIRASETAGMDTATAKVDHVRCTVYFTETGSGASGVQTRVARTRRYAQTRM